MSNIVQVIARVTVPELSTAVPFYQELGGAEAASTFQYAGVHLASVSPFLLLSGDRAAEFSDRRATLVVRDLTPVTNALRRAGGQVLDGPAPGPSGPRMIARHPDGAVFEYIELPRQD
ncbi:VOC family protein [Streptomyces sp. NPDC004267]|uniref:VOC family protein n=1 Tax=Streptomyces sp. NPDC004267 TaxID=3364694 RepID=UPI00367EC6DC